MIKTRTRQRRRRPEYSPPVWLDDRRRVETAAEDDDDDADGGQCRRTIKCSVSGVGKSSVHLVILVFVAFVCHTAPTLRFADASIIPAPPTITRQTLGEQLFQIESQTMDSKSQPFILECEAASEPAANFTWRKNGEPWNWLDYADRVTQLAGRGTLQFYQMSEDDEGFYQCVATNHHGTALGFGVLLKQAVLDSFSMSEMQLQRKSVVEGETLSVPCTNSLHGYPRPKLYWFEKEAERQVRNLQSPRLRIDPAGTLHFSNVTRADERMDGYYVCVASSDFRGELKLGPKFNLQVMPSGLHGLPSPKPPLEQFTTQSNIMVLRGKRLEIFCIFSGSPLPTIRWRKENGILPDDRTVIDPQRQHILEIRQIDFADEGVYVCEASNGVGSGHTRRFKVTVEAAPYWIRRPENVRAAEEEEVEFECMAGGQPEPKVRWFVNGVPIEEAPANPRRQALVSRKALIVRNLHKSDTAVYQCNATNVHGYAFQDFYLNVLALPPELTEPPQPKYEVVEGKSLTITCKVFGAPKPTVKWEHNDQPIHSLKHILLSDGDLLIKNIDSDDAGHFRCVANNKFGSIRSSPNVGIVEVREATRLVTVPEDVETAVGQTTAFRCSALVDRHLELRVDWLFNGQRIYFDQEPRHFFSEADKTLTITKVKQTDMGAYTCVASTRLDTVNATAELVVQDVPNAPLFLEMTCNRVTAKIEWQSRGDNRAPILGYVIQYNTTFDSDKWEDAMPPVPPNDFRFQVALSPWTNYSFRVLARNKIGISPPSDVSGSCSTPPDVPYKNPENVIGSGIKPNHLIISWKPMPPIEHNAPGFFYRVYWRRLETPEDDDDYRAYLSKKELAVDTAGKKDILDRDFYIDVEGQASRDDDSLFADDPNDDPPPPPVQKISRKSKKNFDDDEFIGRMEEKASKLVPKKLTLSDIDYASAENDNGNDHRGKASPVTSLEDMLDRGWHVRNVTDWRDSTFIVDGTQTYKPYRIKVEAHNVLGQANVAAIEVIGHSGEDVPLERPGNLTLIDIVDATTAVLSWSPVSPASVRGNFKGYKIQVWTSKFGPERKREITVLPDVTKERVAILVPHAINFVHVFAYNGQYAGPPSEVLDFTTPEGKPGPVESFEAVPMGSNALFLAWKKPKPEDQNGVLNGYKVYYQTVDGVKIGPVMEKDPPITNPNETRVKLTGLEPGTKYRVTIHATTSAGQGVPYFVEAETRSTPAKQPGKPSFMWSHIPVEGNRAAVRVTWIPDFEGTPGSHFYVKFKRKGEVQYHKTVEEHFEDSIVVDNLEPGTVYEMSVVSVDGGYMTPSDTEEVETWGTGKLYAPRPVQTFAATGWFIGIMLAIIFVTLVLIIICIVKRSRGGKYDVHEKEVTRGKKDYDYPDEGGFNEYTKGHGERNQLMGSKTSIESSLKPAESDTDSMAEYGEGGETGKFNEEGSFIGAYRPKRRQHPDETSPVATLV